MSLAEDSFHLVDNLNKYRYLILTVMLAALVAAAAGSLGCDGGEPAGTTPTAATSTQNLPATTATPTTTTATPTSGIQLPANLQSGSGTPAASEMPALIGLQAKVPYPVIAPTYLPSGHVLEPDLIGYSSRTAKDPVGYYSFRFADPSNANRSLTFNQSRSNSKPLSGYYLTEEEINGVNYMIYWHKTRDYLPEGEPVRTYAVGESETFVVVWRSQYNDPVNGPQELWYSMQSGTWTTSWGEIRSVLESLKPLGSVAEAS